jgi:hypothetical protein
MKVIALEAGESDLYASEKTLRTIQGFLNVYSGTSQRRATKEAIRRRTEIKRPPEGMRNLV